MVTKEEFKELKENYYKPEYCTTDIIITTYFPEKLLVSIPYKRDYWGNTVDTRRQLVEITPNEICYYGCNGNKIKGDYISSWLYCEKDISNVIGNKCRDEIIFLIGNGSRALNFKNLRELFNNKLTDFINELKKENIYNKNLFSYYYLYFKTNSKFNIKTFAEDELNLNVKQLREFAKYYFGSDRLIYGLKHIIKYLKNLFSCSIKELCEYIPVYDYVVLNTYEDKKYLRAQYRYCAELYKYNKEYLNNYRDYVRCRFTLDQESKKNWPLYPKDFSKIEKLHNDIVDFMNKEQDRIFAAKQVEKQNKYISKFYEEAKKLETNDDTYSIIAVKELIDLVKEGRSLNHCVGSYIDSVSNGREYILFLRKKDDIDVPFYTIDVTPDRKIRQIHGKNNCSVTKEIKPFIDKWISKFKLDGSNYSGIYCHL